MCARSSSRSHLGTLTIGDAMTTGFVAWRRYGEHGALIEFDTADATLNAYGVCRSGAFDECVPGARTIYVEATGRTSAELVRMVESMLRDPPMVVRAEAVRTHIFPVHYDGADLENVANITGLSVEDVIQRHSGVTYTVAFLGFSRSFAYLAGIDPAIIVPRLQTPRTLVPEGSVAIGAGYTGIYPMASPGGWQLLGRTDSVLFDTANDPPGIWATGDHVRFVRVV